MVTSLAATSRPTARLLEGLPSTIWISGRATVGRARASTPTLPPAPSLPGLVSPMVAAWVVPSITVPARVIGGRAVAGAMVKTPVAAS